MTSVDDIYELLNPAEQRWETISASGRAWQDRLANRDALVARHQLPGRTKRVGRTHNQIAGADSAVIGQREQEWRLWRGGPMLIRSEYSIGKETVTVVGQGPRWWRWSPVLGATSGGGPGRPLRLLLGPVGALVDPERFFEQLEIAVIGQVVAAGRPAHRVEGVPVAVRGRARLALREAGTGADRYEILVDAERGVLLGIEAFVGDQPFQRVDVTDIVFDSVLSPQLFSPEHSSDESFVKARSPQQRLGFDALVGEVDFVVLVPAVPPTEIAPYVALFDSDRRGFGPRHAVITYAIVDPAIGRGQLRITEAKSDLLRSTRDKWQMRDGFEFSEERHGRVQRRRVRTVREGTYCEIESALLPLDQLIAVAQSLVPHVVTKTASPELPEGT